MKPCGSRGDFFWELESKSTVMRLQRYLPGVEVGDKVRQIMRRAGKVWAAALVLGMTVAAVPSGVEAAKKGFSGPEALESVAVVDLQRCFMETAEGKSAQAKIQAAAEKTEKRLSEKSDELRKAIEDLRAKAAMLAPQEVERRQQELMRKDAELQQIYAESSQALSAKEAELTDKIYQRVQKIVADIAKAEGVQAVIVRSQMSVLYVTPRLDLTNKVILAYDKKHKG